MKLLKLYLFMALLAMSGRAMADNLHVEDFTIEPGETKTISVELSNPDESYIMLEFKMSLPEGITIARDEYDELQVVPNGNRFTRTHVLEAEDLGNGVYKFLIYSTRNVALAGSEGELFTITLTASESMAAGAYQGRFFNQVFANENKEEINPVEVVFGFSVTSALLGDVNSDGQISIADVTALVNIILGKDNSKPYQYDHDAADLNGDGGTSIADVTALVNIILGKP